MEDGVLLDGIEAEKMRQKKLVEELELHLGCELGAGAEYTPQGQVIPTTLVD